MISEIPTGIMVLSIVFAVCSLVLCVVQLVYRNRVKILSICNASVFVPLLILLMGAASGLSRAFHDITIAANITRPMWYAAISRMLASIYLGLIITIILLIVYAITKSLYENKQQ